MFIKAVAKWKCTNPEALLPDKRDAVDYSTAPGPVIDLLPVQQTVTGWKRQQNNKKSKLMSVYAE